MVVWFVHTPAGNACVESFRRYGPVDKMKNFNADLSADQDGVQQQQRLEIAGCTMDCFVWPCMRCNAVFILFKSSSFVII